MIYKALTTKFDFQIVLNGKKKITCADQDFTYPGLKHKLKLINIV